MPIGYIYWVLMILWFIFGFWWNYPAPGSGRAGFGPIGGHVLMFALFFLLGWREFGFVIHN